MTKHNPAKVLEEYQKKGYNILTPSVSLDGLGENWVATIKTVSLSPNPLDGDVYLNKADEKKKPAERRYILKSQGLERLAVMAGVIWHEVGGSRRTDNGKDPNYIAMEAFGAIRMADGTLAPSVGSYDIDLIAKEEDLKFEYITKGKNYKKSGQELDDYVEFCVGREIRRIRNHKRTLCESGAQNRVIRKLLGIKLYTKAQLQKPFVCVSIRYQPDESDPEVKRMLTMASIGATSQIYGMPPAPRALPPPAEQAEYVSHSDEAEVPVHENGVYEEDGEIADELETSQEALDFENWDRKSQITELENMAKIKAYDLNGLLERWDKTLLEITDDQIIQVFEFLAEKPDDDIPF